MDLYGAATCLWSKRVGWLLVQRPVRAMAVIMSYILGEDGGQMSLAEDEHAVGALAANGAHPAFGMCVGPSRQLDPMSRVVWLFG